VAPAVHRHVRRALIHRFPYALYFTLAADRIEVVAVLHTRRDPTTWRRRA
jgi:plasmid stabilization system protein ParE